MMDWSKYFVYDETSLSCLRWATTIKSGRGYARVMVLEGEVAGNISKDGYYTVGINNKTYKVHRIIYEITSGTKLQRKLEIDHKDGNRSNNLIANLRLVPKVINARNKTIRENNSTGVTGVYFQVKNRREYCISVHHKDGKQRALYFSVNKLGREVAFKMACKARSDAIQSLNQQGAGYTERHGT